MIFPEIKKGVTKFMHDFNLIGIFFCVSSSIIFFVLFFSSSASSKLESSILLYYSVQTFYYTLSSLHKIIYFNSFTISK